MAQRLRSDVPFQVISSHKSSWFKPLLKHDPDAPVLAANSPLPSDVDMLLHGHFVPPQRLVPSWQIVSHWLDLLSRATLRLDIDRATAEKLDFDLARAGVSSHLGLRTLWARAASLPLLPPPGNEIGYQRHLAAVELGEAWRGSIGALEGSTDLVTYVSDWLCQLPEWARDAEGAGRPAPDVFALVQP